MADEIVYVIDDHPGVRDALSDILDAFGYAHACFANASEYLEAERKDPASCIVLDVRLPDINGLDLQDMLAEETSPPIVFMSGFADIPSTVRAMKNGATEFRTKPVDAEALLTAIREALAKGSKLRMRRAEISRIEERFKSLTPREREVFSLVVAGMLNKQSAIGFGAFARPSRREKAMARSRASPSPAKLSVRADKTDWLRPPGSFSTY